MCLWFNPFHCSEVKLRFDLGQSCCRFGNHDRPDRDDLFDLLLDPAFKARTI